MLYNHYFDQKIKNLAKLDQGKDKLKWIMMALENFWSVSWLKRYLSQVFIYFWHIENWIRPDFEINEARALFVESRNPRF